MINKITFVDKNKEGQSKQQIELLDSDINIIKSTINLCIDFISNLDLVLSVNGESGKVNFKFPVLSVNGETGIVNIQPKVTSVNGNIENINIQFPVTSVNNKKGNVKIQFPVTKVNNKDGNIVLKISELYNDNKYIVANDLPILSVNNKIGNVTFKISQFDNQLNLITKADLLVTSVNGKKGAVEIIPPVLSVNGQKDNIIFTGVSIVEKVNNKIGKVVLKISDVENINGYITASDIPVKSISITNNKADTTITKNKVKIFVPNKISQVDNDSNFYNNTNQFIKIKDGQVDDVSNFISCRIQKDAAFIDLKICEACGKCLQACTYNAIKTSSINGNLIYVVTPSLCTNCNKCKTSCEVNAITTKKQ